MKKKFVITEYTFCDGWIAIESDMDGNLITYDSEEECEKQITEMVNGWNEKIKKEGENFALYNIEDFEAEELTEKTKLRDGIKPYFKTTLNRRKK